MDIFEKHNEIYHYTTEAGLQGILTSQNIRASHFQSLNDATELKYAKNIIIARLAKIVGKEKAKFYSDSLYNSLGEEIYITSFCGYNYDQHCEKDFIRNNGLLSQWRGYGKDGGYILVFNTNQLWSIITKQREEKKFGGVVFGDAIYDQKSEEVSTHLEPLAKFIKEYKETNNPSPSNGLTPFLHLASRLKHHAFQEENEIRFATLRTLPRSKKDLDKKIPVIKNINGSAYIELPFDLAAIKKIIIGPQRNQKDKEHQLKEWLQDRELDIPVTCSEIPYIQ